MFDIGWSELFVIAVVAVVVVGPKDLPRMLRAFGNTVGKLKKMSGEFQRQFNEAIQEAELDEVRKSMEQIGTIDPLADVKKSLEPANQIGADIQRELEKPIGTTPTTPGTPAAAASAALAATAPAIAVDPTLAGLSAAELDSDPEGLASWARRGSETAADIPPASGQSPSPAEPSTPPLVPRGWFNGAPVMGPAEETPEALPSRRPVDLVALLNPQASRAASETAEASEAEPRTRNAEGGSA